MPRPRKNEEGFILIAAIWLLLLAAVVVAVLMLRGYERATTAATVSDRLQTRLLLESAIETVISDLLFNGSASRWAGLPSTGSITLDGGSVAITVSSESGRLDLNTIEPATLDTALRGFGVSALARDSLAAALSVRRQTKNPIAAWADVEHVLAAPAADIAAKHCLTDEVTIYSAIAQPDDRYMSAALAQALGGGTEAGAGGTIEPGSAIRIVARLDSGLAMTAVVRITGQVNRPFEISRLDSRAGCF